MDEVLKRFDQFTGLIANIAKEYGPDVVSTVSTLLQLQAAGLVIVPIVAIIVTLLVVRLVWFPYFRWNINVAVPAALANHHRYDKGAHWPGVIVSGIFLIVWSFVWLIVMFKQTFDPVLWGAMFDPRIAIAAKVMGYL